LDRASLKASLFRRREYTGSSPKYANPLAVLAVPSQAWIEAIRIVAVAGIDPEKQREFVRLHHGNFERKFMITYYLELGSE
jgi:hypothetical protein